MRLGDAPFYAIVLIAIASKKTSGSSEFIESPEIARPSSIQKQGARLIALKGIADSAIMNNSEFRLASDSAFMAQTVIWHHADQLYKSEDFENAAKWYGFGTHRLFLETEELTFTKLARKASLSWVNHGNYEMAEACLTKLPSHGQEEAGTHFISFMIDSAQGLEDQAAHAIDRMMSCMDFKPETLLYAARQAEQRGLQKLLHHILQSILDATSGHGDVRVLEGLDLVILLRSLIKIDMSNFKTSHRDK